MSKRRKDNACAASRPISLLELPPHVVLFVTSNLAGTDVAHFQATGRDANATLLDPGAGQAVWDSLYRPNDDTPTSTRRALHI